MSVTKVRRALVIAVAVLFAAGIAAADAREKPRLREPARTTGAATPNEATRAPRGEAPQRVPFSEADQALAAIPGMPDVRFWSDSTGDFFRALPKSEGPWLALSSGGLAGSYGAGVLYGWSQSGSRPVFSVVTGVSTGALMAPFVFAGTRYDEALRDSFTRITAADVFEDALPGSPGLLDTWPLKDTIAKRITPALLADVAAEHQRGRRLFVVTTNLDAERAVVWDMGAIAAHGGEDALALFRQVLLASSSIPGTFPPVAIDVEGGGRQFQEMHADGSIGWPFFVAPESVLVGRTDVTLPATQIFVVINGKLTPEFALSEASPISVLARAIAAGLKAASRAEIALVTDAARQQGIELNLAVVDDGFTHPYHGVVDVAYMGALFDYGAAQGRAGSAFHSLAPPPSHRVERTVAPPPGTP